MINSLANPTVCVIDEDPRDYEPILESLNLRFIPTIHILGNDIEQLPDIPFNSLRLVFTDLYLAAGAVGKDMASHTANVFRRVVSPGTGPVVVVIWSKHASEHVEGEEGEITESKLFQKTLLEAEPQFKDRLIFVEMPKPHRGDRGEDEDWIKELFLKINTCLEGLEAIQLLWQWESKIKDSALRVSEGLTSTTLPPNTSLADGLKDILRLLANAMKEGNLTAESAPQYLNLALAQILLDQIEHNKNPDMSEHGAWLSGPTNNNAILAPQINSLLLTAEAPENGLMFLPGTVYEIVDEAFFEHYLGINKTPYFESFLQPTLQTTIKEEVLANIKPIAIEISPVCDVQQANRSVATFVAGLIVPTKYRNNLKKATGSFLTLPNFKIRWEIEGLDCSDCFIMLSTRYRISLPLIDNTALAARFRIREIPTASIRNSISDATARIGYASINSK